ncbi:MAG: class E sortase [Gaiellaceae bacterium]
MSFRSLLRALVVVGTGLAFASPVTAAPSPRLVIPRLHLDVPVASQLEGGPRLYYRDQDTIGIAGHRTTHTHPFLHLPKLRRGDQIRLGRTRYEVRRSVVVRPTELWVLRYTGLVLSACHPAGSAKFRYVVFAARVS